MPSLSYLFKCETSQITKPNRESCQLKLHSHFPYYRRQVLSRAYTRRLILDGTLLRMPDDRQEDQ
jgi:hypothetical protein